MPKIRIQYVGAGVLAAVLVLILMAYGPTSLGRRPLVGRQTHGDDFSHGVLEFAEQGHARNTFGASPATGQRTQAHVPNQVANGAQTHPSGMLCWLVTMSEGVELELVKDHYGHKRSVFACDDYVVFSDTTDLSPIVATDIGALRSKRAPWGGWYNTLVFLHAWGSLAKEGKFANFQWVVKVDADSVFFPDRLWAHLHDAAWSKPVYLKGGKMLLGAIEVFSNAAVHAFAKRGARVCTEDIEVSGEDGFINSCMGQLDVHASIDHSLLKSTTNVQDCTDGRFVAFHPFVSIQSFDACFSLAAQNTV